MPPCQDRGLLSVPSLRISCKRPSTPWAAELSRSKPSNASGLCCFFMSDRPWETTRRRLFYVVDNGSSHRGQTSVERMRRRDKRIILVHTPVHASWLNQVEIYFSIVQRKVLTPNDFATLDAIRLRLALYEQLSNRTPRPFAWKFTRQDLLNWLKRAAPHFLAASAA